MINLNKHFGIKKDKISRNYSMNDPTNMFTKTNSQYSIPSKNIYPCKKCGREFTTMTELKWHMLMAHKEK